MSSSDDTKGETTRNGRRFIGNGQGLPIRHPERVECKTAGVESLGNLKRHAADFPLNTGDGLHQLLRNRLDRLLRQGTHVVAEWMVASKGIFTFRQLSAQNKDGVPRSVERQITRQAKQSISDRLRVIGGQVAEEPDLWMEDPLAVRTLDLDDVFL